MNLCKKINQNKLNFYNSGFEDNMEYVDSCKWQECGIFYAKSKSES